MLARTDQIQVLEDKTVRSHFRGMLVHGACDTKMIASPRFFLAHRFNFRKGPSFIAHENALASEQPITHR